MEEMSKYGRIGDATTREDMHREAAFRRMLAPKQRAALGRGSADPDRLRFAPASSSSATSSLA
jgi:hypothetical protein